MPTPSHSPSGNQSVDKESHCASNNYDPVIPCTVCPICTSSRRSFVVQGDPARPGENRNKCSKLTSAPTHRERIGGLCCLLWFQSTSTTRPSKHSESLYSLTVPSPASTPSHPHPWRLLFSVLAPGVAVRVNEEGTTASLQHGRRKPPSWLIDFVFSS